MTLSLSGQARSRTSLGFDRATAGPVARVLGDLRGWLGEELRSIRVAQMDDAFFATAKGGQYQPTIADASHRPPTFRSSL